jgi:hypothetical protein
MHSLQQLNSIYTIINNNNLNIQTPTTKQLSTFIKYSSLNINKNITTEQKLTLYYLDQLFNISSLIK